MFVLSLRSRVFLRHSVTVSSAYISHSLPLLFQKSPKPSKMTASWSTIRPTSKALSFQKVSSEQRHMYHSPRSNCTASQEIRLLAILWVDETGSDAIPTLSLFRRPSGAIFAVAYRIGWTMWCVEGLEMTVATKTAWRTLEPSGIAVFTMPNKISSLYKPHLMFITVKERNRDACNGVTAYRKFYVTAESSVAQAANDLMHRFISDSHKSLASVLHKWNYWRIQSIQPPLSINHSWSCGRQWIPCSVATVCAALSFLISVRASLDSGENLVCG